ncbi:MAG: hypothetical protein JWP44_3082 [Mucilaginibacter sp.]|nr:hypothetical protein [Mucilaginibacter sp.]
MLQVFVLVFVLFTCYTVVYILFKRSLCFNYRPLIHITAILFILICLSFLYYIVLLTGQNFTRLLAMLFIVSIFLLCYFRKSIKATFSVNAGKGSNIGNLLALIAVLTLTLYFVFHGSKYGGWDAWAMWNLKARYLFYPDYWKNIFVPAMSFSSRDYPLMLPSIIAFLCHAVSSDTPLVPMLFSYVILILVPLLVYYALWREELYLYAFLALVIFVFDDSFKQLAMAQEADTLLSLLILLTFVLYNTLDSKGGHQVSILAFICASCAWEKNEGIVFMLLFSGCFIITNYRNYAILKNYAAGSIIPVIIWASFKLGYTPSNTVMANNATAATLIMHLTDTGRYLVITKAWVIMLFTKYLILIVLTLAALIANRRALLRLPFAVISLLMVAYFAVYLIAPGELNWLLSTSLVRLFLHVYPSLVYLLLALPKKSKNVLVQPVYSSFTETSKQTFK